MRQDSLNRPERSIPDAVLYWWLPLAYTLCFCACSTLQVFFFDVNDWDFSYFLTQPWRIAQGWDAAVPFADSVSVDVFWAHHLTGLGFLLAPLFRIFPSPYTLALLHACACGLTAFALPRLVRQIYADFAPAQDRESRLRWSALCLLVIFFFFQPYLGAFRYATHYTTLVSPLTFWAVLWLHQRRMTRFWLCCCVICLAQERAVVTVCCLGMYAFLLLGERRLGVALCALSCLLFFGAVKVALPWLREWAGCADTGYAFQNGLAPLAMLPEKGRFLAVCLLCTLGLPLCGRRAAAAALCALPLLAMALVSNREGMFDFWHHYHDIAAVFLLCAMAYGLLRLQERLPARHWKRLFALGTLVYCVAHVASPYQASQPVVRSAMLLTLPHADELRRLNDDIRVFDNLPEHVALYVQSGLGPRLSLHKNRYLACATAIKQAAAHVSLMALSPLCGQYELGGSYAEIAAMADAAPGLTLLADTGRLRIYASERLCAEAPGVAAGLRRSLEPRRHLPPASSWP